METLPRELKEIQDEQRKENWALVEKYDRKFKFSYKTLIFSVTCLFISFFGSGYLGIILPALFGTLTLVFIQQTIRSFNYRKGHLNGYYFMESVYRELEKAIEYK